MDQKSLHLVLGILLILAAGGVFWYQYMGNTSYIYRPIDQPADNTRSIEINSFATCKVAGYPIMESYPARCRTPEGLLFVNYEMCVQVIAYARNPQTGEIRMFPTPCDVPQGWEETPNPN